MFVICYGSRGKRVHCPESVVSTCPCWPSLPRGSRSHSVPVPVVLKACRKAKCSFSLRFSLSFTWRVFLWLPPTQCSLLPLLLSVSRCCCCSESQFPTEYLAKEKTVIQRPRDHQFVSNEDNIHFSTKYIHSINIS